MSFIRSLDVPSTCYWPYWNSIQSFIAYIGFLMYVNKMEEDFRNWTKDPAELLDPKYGGILYSVGLNCTVGS